MLWCCLKLVFSLISQPGLPSLFWPSSFLPHSHASQLSSLKTTFLLMQCGRYMLVFLVTDNSSNLHHRKCSSGVFWSMTFPFRSKIPRGFQCISSSLLLLLSFFHMKIAYFCKFTEPFLNYYIFYHFPMEGSIQETFMRVSQSLLPDISYKEHPVILRNVP